MQCPKWVIRVVSAMSAVSPLYPQEPTSSVRPATSEKCQERTMHGGKNASLLDHLIGGRPQCRGHGEAKRFRGLGVGDQFELRRLFHPPLGRRRPAGRLIRPASCPPTPVHTLPP